jgi:hypothetical protein
MARRSKPYLIHCHLGEIEMPARDWQRYVSAGYLRVIRDRIARPGRNIIAWLEAGKLHLLHAYWIYTSWIAISRTRWVTEGDEYEHEMRRQWATEAFKREMKRMGYLPAGYFITK